jgi:hypothetical protein
MKCDGKWVKGGTPLWEFEGETLKDFKEARNGKENDSFDDIGRLRHQ